MVNSAQCSEISTQTINDLAAAFQKRAFEHLLRVTRATLNSQPTMPNDFLVGGGVAANTKLREEIKRLSDEVGINVYFPAKGLYGDNAAMIGLAAGFKAQRGNLLTRTKLTGFPVGKWMRSKVKLPRGQKLRSSEI